MPAAERPKPSGWSPVPVAIKMETPAPPCLSVDPAVDPAADTVRKITPTSAATKPPAKAIAKKKTTPSGSGSSPMPFSNALDKKFADSPAKPAGGGLMGSAPTGSSAAALGMRAAGKTAASSSPLAAAMGRLSKTKRSTPSGSSTLTPHVNTVGKRTPSSSAKKSAAGSARNMKPSGASTTPPAANSAAKSKRSASFTDPSGDPGEKSHPLCSRTMPATNVAVTTRMYGPPPPAARQAPKRKGMVETAVEAKAKKVKWTTEPTSSHKEAADRAGDPPKPGDPSRKHVESASRRQRPEWRTAKAGRSARPPPGEAEAKRKVRFSPSCDPESWVLKGKFRRPRSKLPAPLPTVQDIVTQPTEVLKCYPDCKVVRMGAHYVVKYGTRVSLMEGETQLYLRECLPDLPVPEIYAFFYDETERANFVITEYVAGDALDNTALELSEETWDSIQSQLGDMLAAIRSLPAPSYFGKLGRRPLDNILFAETREHRPLGTEAVMRGPFRSTGALCYGLYLNLMGDLPDPAETAYFDEVVFPDVLFRSGDPELARPVFTHGDLHPRNVVLRRDGRIAVIDWEAAGWLPAWYEYAAALLFTGPWDDRWRRVLGGAVRGEDYPAQWLVVERVWAMLERSHRKKREKVEAFRAAERQERIRGILGAQRDYRINMDLRKNPERWERAESVGRDGADHAWW